MMKTMRHSFGHFCIAGDCNDIERAKSKGIGIDFCLYTRLDKQKVVSEIN